MKAQRRGDIVVGLDVGTTKVCAIVAECGEEGVDVVGVGTVPSKGVKKGTVVNIEMTVQAIKKAIEEAALMAGCEVRRVNLGIAGGHIRGFNSHGIVALKSKEVRMADVNRVMEAARATNIPSDRQVIHVMPQDYVIDDQGGVKDPVGMTGARLEVKVHIVTASRTSARNLVKCCNQAGFDVADVVLQQIASAHAVITDDEREMGSVLIDIGGGTTDVAVFKNGALMHTAVIPVGGQLLSADIAQGLRTPRDEAERIKQKYGLARTEGAQADEMIQVPSVGGRPSRELSKAILAEIIEPRLEELFSAIQQELSHSGCADIIRSGAVLTGGTTSLGGMESLAEEVLDMPVRIGVPGGVGGLIDVVRHAKYSTAVGLVLSALAEDPTNKGHKRSNSGFPLFRKVADFWKDVV